MYVLFSAPNILINNPNDPMSKFLDDFFSGIEEIGMASYAYLESQCLDL